MHPSLAASAAAPLPADAPEQALGLLRALAAARDYETAVALSNFVAAFVHPDYVCNLADVQNVPDDAKASALAFFEYCMRVGLSVEEQGAILTWLQPYLHRTLGAPRAH